MPVIQSVLFQTLASIAALNFVLDSPVKNLSIFLALWLRLSSSLERQLTFCSSYNFIVQPQKCAEREGQRLYVE